MGGAHNLMANTQGGLGDKGKKAEKPQIDDNKPKDKPKGVGSAVSATKETKDVISE